MATYVFENMDDSLFLQFKKFADSLGVGFRVIDKANINQKNLSSQSDDIMTYAGIFRGAWGETPEQVETSIAELKAEWER